MRKTFALFSILLLALSVGCEKTIREAKGPASPDRDVRIALVSARSCAVSTSP